jgi:hypothetical protein
MVKPWDDGKGEPKATRCLRQRCQFDDAVEIARRIKEINPSRGISRRAWKSILFILGGRFLPETPEERTSMHPSSSRIGANVKSVASSMAASPDFRRLHYPVAPKSPFSDGIVR